MKPEELIQSIADDMTRLAVTSRVTKVPVRRDLKPFRGKPLQIEAYRRPSKATRLWIACGEFTGYRVVTDQTSKSIRQAAITLATRVLASAVLFS